MKHHAFMLWTLLIFSFHVLASSGHYPGLQQASWEIFIYDFGSKTPQLPTNTDKKQARQISSPSCPTAKPMMSAPVNDARKGNTFSSTCT
ncbi:virulence factor [Salmonella enterica]|uniref:Virulence factor n=3 Tax=Salmonella TaxID=590 RepID=A0A3R0PIW0_SALET|nr:MULTISPECIES: virulence protein PagD [Salmonella]EBA1415725.1 virulence factor [Salmonella enterica subsp. enterica serovar Enteritidis]EBC9851112.1 virulence factor [Salmonella enterica subsp. enterica serovar Agama]ECQ3981911.1 virulence factor [Salmonella enterica subsp. enterica serovar Infantis]EDS4905854.1 virulence factor [Salmonella enterica subsp. enterica serovar Mbandaka]EDU9827668.1 virulence factor [Salmonella enterica subsp. enterica serovar Lexington]EDX9411810.1 virulence f